MGGVGWGLTIVEDGDEAGGSRLGRWMARKRGELPSASRTFTSAPA